MARYTQGGKGRVAEGKRDAYSALGGRRYGYAISPFDLR
jgi:hypothetical protein